MTQPVKHPIPHVHHEHINIIARRVARLEKDFLSFPENARAGAYQLLMKSLETLAGNAKVFPEHPNQGTITE